MARSSRGSARTLATLATEQGGYFTAKQAKKAGYDYPHLQYHLSTGSFERIDHGLYRLPTLPRDEHDDLIRLCLWSRNQTDEPQAVVSHDSALVLHEMTDLLPNRIHLGVPHTFRKSTPNGCVLHKAVFAEGDVEERVGFRVTTPFRTLLDAAESDVSQEEFEKSVSNALSRGLVRRTKLAQVVGKNPHLLRLKAALDRLKAGAK